MTLTRQYLESRCWAILPEYLELMAAIEERDVEDRDAVVKAIETRFGKIVSGTRETRIRGDVAIIPVEGPLFRYANLFTDISGATSYERLALDIGTVMRSDDVRHVIFDINSPGGEVDGMSETAALIRSYRGQKRMTAFVSMLGASAAYGLAAAADEIVAMDMSMVGSIGTVLGIRDTRDRDKKLGVRRLEIVSSQTPLKRIDPFDDDPAKRDQARLILQKRVDSLAQVFIDNTAADRGRKPNTIAALEGAIFVGQEALEAGLVDRIGTLESLIKGSTAGESGRMTVAASSGIHSEEDSMAAGEKTTEPAAPAITRAYLDANHPELVKAIKDEGVVAGRTEALEKGKEEGATAERDRILGILSIDAKGHEDLRKTCLADAKVSKGDAALKILEARGAADSQKREEVKDALKKDEKDVAAVGTVPAGEAENEDAEAEATAKSIASQVVAFQKSGVE